MSTQPEITIEPLNLATAPPEQVWALIRGYLAQRTGVYNRPQVPAELTAPYILKIQRAFTQGLHCVAAHDNAATPTIDESAGPEELGVLFNYFQSGMQCALTRLPQALPAQPAQAPAPKVAAPEPFDGNRAKYQAFVVQLQLVFNSDPARYANDPARIAYAASYLTGSAKEWFLPRINPTTGAINFETYAAFIEGLRAAFDDPDARATAERKLLSLKQGKRDCSAYHAEFVTYAAPLDMDARMKTSLFRRGLNTEVQRALAVQANPPDNFDAFVQLCIKLDNNIRALPVSESRAPPRITSHPEPSTSTATGTQPGPMDLSRIDRTSRKRAPLSEDVKKHRRDNNLCLYCGNPGHWATNCPIKKPAPARANATITNPEPTPAPAAASAAVTFIPASVEPALYAAKN